MKTEIKQGTRVRYATNWLRNTCQYSGPEAPTSSGPFARGVVIGMLPSVVNVKWDDGSVSSALITNLEGEHDPVY